MLPLVPLTACVESAHARVVSQTAQLVEDQVEMDPVGICVRRCRPEQACALIVGAECAADLGQQPRGTGAHGEGRGILGETPSARALIGVRRRAASESGEDAAGLAQNGVATSTPLCGLNSYMNLCEHVWARWLQMQG